MNILMIFAGMVENLPPLLTAASSLAAQGERVTIAAAGCSALTKSFLGERGVTVATCNLEDLPASKPGKAFFVARFIRFSRAAIARIEPDVVWYHGRHSMRYAWFCSGARRRLLVAHAHEMDSPTSIDGRLQQAILRRAGMVIVPEVNRAWMMKMRSRSRAPFVVIPNRLPEYALPDGANTDEARSAFLAAGGSAECRDFVIYQGRMHLDRCVAEALEGFRQLGRADWGFIVMCNEEDRTVALRSRYREDRRIVFLPRVEPPHHLRITRGCRLGVLLYAPTNLNNVYCAPNKVFEYAYFGLGMIFPDYPGLRSLEREFSLGEVCNPLDPVSIASALSRAMSTPREHYERACARFLRTIPDPLHAYAQLAEILRAQRLRGGAGTAAAPGRVLDLGRYCGETPSEVSLAQ